MAANATRSLPLRVSVGLAVAGWGLVAACSGSSTSAPSGSGNVVINDTRDASVRAPANPDPGDDAGDDSGPVYVYGEGGTSSFPGLAECGDCTCSPDAHYCFGGATASEVAQFHARFPLAAADAGKDAGLPACPVVSGSTPQLGCNALPAGCSDCACVINALQPNYACYLVCASDSTGSPMTVYCPNG